MRTMHGRRPGLLLAIAVCGFGAFVGCSEPAEPVTAEAYLDALEAICVGTTAELPALPAPPEQISVTDFATRAAELLDGEADRVDRLDVPDDGALRADPRAFARNTEEPADAWRTIADGGGGSADLVASADLVRQLVLGRNDLAEEIGAPACRRDG